MAAVSSAAAVLEEVHGRDVYDRPGFRAALIETSVVLNAALTAAILGHAFAGQLGENLNVVFGVYDLVSRQVGVPGDGVPGNGVPDADEAGEGVAWRPGLLPPPEGDAQFMDLGRSVSRSEYVVQLLYG
jgi:carbonic anhydrase